MREITMRMINFYKIKEISDFMGYNLQKDTPTFHHNIVFKRDCKRLHIPQEGYVWWNGAIIYRSPHDYLHTIERYDFDRYLALRDLMKQENEQGKIDIESLLRIDDVLSSFEREYSGTSNGSKPIIKEEYTRRLVKEKKWRNNI